MIAQRLLARLFRRQRIYEDLAQEMRAHIDEKTDELIARGLSPADARDAARRSFGNVTSLAERGRDTWAWPTVESFAGDVRYALRQLRRAPAVGVIIVLTLAVGIAATTTVFSWARAILLNPLPGTGDPARVFALESTTPSGSWTPTSWLDYRDFQKYLKSIDGLAATYPTVLALGDATHAERRRAELVSANFFDVLRVAPALGRFFAASRDEAQGSQPAVVIGYALWQSRWHGDSSVIGQVVDINRFPFTVIGVAPAGFHGSMAGEQVELWVPAAMLGQIVPTGSWWLADRGTRTFRVLARLAPGVSPAAAGAEVASFARTMAAANADVNKGMGGVLLPLWESHWGVQDSLRAPLIVLSAACVLVLLVVCANAANLLVARATSRRRELTLRLALGAPRRRLLRQLLTEASLLALGGTGVGLLAAVWLARSLRWLVPAFAAPALVAPHVDLQVLGFTAVLACVVTLLAGIAPAVYGSRDAFAGELAAGGRGDVGGGPGSRARSMLVVAEMALAVLALVGAGLFYDSFRHERVLPAGFSSDHVAMASVSITLAGYDSAQGDAFLRSVADRVRRAPGISAAAYTDYVPLSLASGSWENLTVEGYAPDPTENMKIFRSAIGPGYFKTLDVPLLEGRDFNFGDDSLHAPVMIVNEAFVHRYLAGRAVLGARVHGWGRWFTIVGVAKDVKTYRLTDPPTPYFYVPVLQVYRPEYGYTFLARTNGSVDAATRAISDAVRAVDPTVPVYDAMSLAAYVGAPLQSTRASAQLLALLSVVAALLAAIGLYGVMAYVVAQRAKEIGVRMALGAQRIHVARAVAVRSGSLLGLGLLAGLIGGAVLARVASSMLYSIGTADVIVFVFAAGSMTLVAAAATMVPAWRAMTIDPLTALRAD